MRINAAPNRLSLSGIFNFMNPKMRAIYSKEPSRDPPATPVDDILDS